VLRRGLTGLKIISIALRNISGVSSTGLGFSSRGVDSVEEDYLGGGLHGRIRDGNKYVSCGEIFLVDSEGFGLFGLHHLFVLSGSDLEEGHDVLGVFPGRVNALGLFHVNGDENGGRSIGLDLDFGLTPFGWGLQLNEILEMGGNIVQNIFFGVEKCGLVVVEVIYLEVLFLVVDDFQKRGFILFV